MKLIRFGNPGKEKPGISINEDKIIDVSAFGEDYNEHFFETDGINRLTAWLKNQQDKCPEVDPKTRLGPPVQRPSKLICVGLNYLDHAKESNMELPKEPILFYKSTSAIVGPNDDLMIPKDSQKTDWEVELGIVIGKKASYVDESEAMNHVAGFVLHNDYSEREFQLEKGGQWLKGKSADTFAPIGPYLVTTDEIADPHNLDIWLKVNSQMMQQSNTSEMIFNIPLLVSYISRFMTLLPGDIISTGTPAGVGMGMKPSSIYLKAGDVVELGISELGTSTQHVKSYQKL